MKKNRNILGFTLGLFLSSLHFIWLLLVAFGVAKPIMDWILMLHHINFQYTIAQFNFGYAAFLVVFTFVVGFVSGWIIGLFWSLMPKK
ncbi:MAG: hypothetical protein WC702_00070 [Patescibacteria group bacterium]|jgi:hypothetical protein